MPHAARSRACDFGSKDFDGSGIRKVHGHDFPGGNTGLFALLLAGPKKASHARELSPMIDTEKQLLQGPARATLADLACRQGSTTLTSPAGGFAADMVGKLLQIESGSTLLPGWYKITAVADAHSATLDHTAAPWADGTAGSGRLDAKPAVRIDLFGIKDGDSIDGQLTAPLRPKQLSEAGQDLPRRSRRPHLGHGPSVHAGHGRFQRGLGGFPGEGRQPGPRPQWRPRRAVPTVARSTSGRTSINVLVLDRHGNRINRRNAQDIFTPLYNHQIPPGAGQVVHYELTVPADVTEPDRIGGARALSQVRFRVHEPRPRRRGQGAETAHRRSCADRVTLPVKGVAETVPAQTSPIEPAWQRWNDYGIGCLLEGGPEGKKGELRQAEEAFQELLERARRKPPVMPI